MSFSLLFLFSTLISLFLSIITFVTNKNSLYGRKIIFFIFTIFIFWWHLFSYIMQLVDNPTLIKIFAKIEYIGVVFVPALFYHFILYSIGIKSNLKLKLAYILSVFFELLLLTTDKFVSGFYVYKWGIFPSGGIVHSFFIVFVVFVTLSALYDLYKKYKETKIKELKEQIKYLGISTFIFSLAAFDFIPNYGIDFYPISFLTMLVFLGLIFYSITKYNLISSSLFMSKIFTLTSISIIVYVLGLIFNFIRDHYLNFILGINEIMFLELLVSFVVVCLVIFLYKKIINLAKHIFNTFDEGENINQITNELNNFNTKEKIFLYLTQKLNFILKTEVYIIYRDNSKILILPENNLNTPEVDIWKEIIKINELIFIPEERLKLIIPNSFKNSILEFLSKNNIEIIVPLEEDIYILFKKRYHRFSKEEVSFIKKITNMISNIKKN